MWVQGCIISAHKKTTFQMFSNWLSLLNYWSCISLVLTFSEPMASNRVEQWNNICGKKTGLFTSMAHPRLKTATPDTSRGHWCTCVWGSYYCYVCVLWLLHENGLMNHCPLGSPLVTKLSPPSKRLVLHFKSMEMDQGRMLWIINKSINWPQCLDEWYG